MAYIEFIAAAGFLLLSLLDLSFILSSISLCGSHTLLLLLYFLRVRGAEVDSIKIMYKDEEGLERVG